MKCHKLNNLNFISRRWHRLWCPDCRKSQHLDTMIGFGLMQMKSAPWAAQGLDTLLSSPMLPEGGRTVRLASRRVAGDWLRRKTQWAGAALIVGCVWWQYMNYIPPVTIPAKVAPEQNAFDYFKVAGIMLKADKDMDKEMEEARQEPRDLPTRERRDAQLKRAGKPLPTIDQLIRIAEREGLPITFEGGLPTNFAGPKHLYNFTPGYVYAGQKTRMPYTLAEKQELLDDNRLALTLLREGFKHPYLDVYPRRFDTLFPDYANSRQLARLLDLETQVKAAKGDWNGAMQSSLDAMQIGAEMAHGAPLIGRLVGNACQIIGEQGAWKAAGHLNAPETRTAIARLQAIRAHQVPFAETIQEEDWFMQASLRDEMAKPGWRANFGSMFGIKEGGGFTLSMLGWSNRVILKDIKSVMDESIRRGRLPYAQSSQLKEIKEPFDPMVQMMFPMFAGAQYRNVYQGEAQPALLITDLALRAYRLEHEGNLPERLEQLTPQYLAQVPTDPFSANSNAPLRYYTLASKIRENQTAAPKQVVYRLAENAQSSHVEGTPHLAGYTLYSVGPDGKDDGGNPVDLLHQPQLKAELSERKITPDSKYRYQVLQSATGDIVAGINTR